MARLFRALFAIVRSLLPWVIHAARFGGILALVAAASFWTGIPNAIGTIGKEWEDQAHRNGIHSRYLPYVNKCGQAVATLLILAGWIILAHAIIVVFLIVF